MTLHAKGSEERKHRINKICGGLRYGMQETEQKDLGISDNDFNAGFGVEDKGLHKADEQYEFEL